MKKTISGLSARALLLLCVAAVFAQGCQVKMRKPAGSVEGTNTGDVLITEADTSGEIAGVAEQTTASFGLRSATAGNSYLHIKTSSTSFVLVGGVSIGH